MASLLDTRLVRTLTLQGEGPPHLSAASGLVLRGAWAWVVADDELHLGRFDADGSVPGQLFPLFEGRLPDKPKARKAAKPDCEALIELPPFAGHADGALLAFGSGSRPTRERGALWVPGPEAAVRVLDLAPLLQPLREPLPDLNIEGGFVAQGLLHLLQRGNTQDGINACITLPWPAFVSWLVAGGPVPRAQAVTRFELGDIDGVPLTFTDGAALADGSWVFSAAAEDTADTYADGRCAGSAIGHVDASGRLQRLKRLHGRHKVEGIAVAAAGPGIELRLVTDADDRSQPGLLLAATLQP